jgi:hypothetical protein
VAVCRTAPQVLRALTPLHLPPATVHPAPLDLRPATVRIPEKELPAPRSWGDVAGTPWFLIVVMVDFKSPAVAYPAFSNGVVAYIAPALGASCICSLLLTSHRLPAWRLAGWLLRRHPPKTSSGRDDSTAGGVAAPGPVPSSLCGRMGAYLVPSLRFFFGSQGPGPSFLRGGSRPDDATSPSGGSTILLTGDRARVPAFHDDGGARRQSPRDHRR